MMWILLEYEDIRYCGETGFELIIFNTKDTQKMPGLMYRLDFKDLHSHGDR